MSRRWSISRWPIGARSGRRATRGPLDGSVGPGIAADAGLTLTTLKVHLSILVSAGLVSIKRTGRTNNYTVRVPSSALKESNRSTTAKRTGHQCHLQTGEPWKAAGVSRRTWYRDRARTDPKTTHGGVRPSGQVALASGTDGQAHGPSDGQAHGPSTKGGSQGVQRTQRRAREEPRQTARTAGGPGPLSLGRSAINADRPGSQTRLSGRRHPTRPRAATGASATARSVTRLNEGTTIPANTATGRGRRGSRGDRHRWAS